MNCLGDTHYLLWALIEPERLDATAEAILRSDKHAKYVSAVSFWEISLKYALGKLELKGITPQQILPASEESGFQILPLEASEAATAHLLPAIAGHKDPFDRLLVWQSIQHKLTLLTADARMREYRKHGLLIVDRR